MKQCMTCKSWRRHGKDGAQVRAVGSCDEFLISTHQSMGCPKHEERKPVTDELAAARKRIEDLETCALRRRSENLVLKKQIESLRDDNENLRVRMLARLDPFKQGERQGLLDRVKVLEEQNKCLLAEAEQKRWRHMDSEALLDRINQLEAHNSQLKCRTEDMALSMGKMSERIGELLDALRAARASTLETMSILRKPTPNDP